MITIFNLHEDKVLEILFSLIAMHNIREVSAF